MSLKQSKTLCRSEKTRWASEVKVKNYIKSKQKRNKNYFRRYYECKDCKGWHLTGTPPMWARKPKRIQSNTGKPKHV